MKKTLSVVVALLMLLTCMLPAFGARTKPVTPAAAKAAYDAGSVVGGNVDDLDYEQIAGVLLDWIDRRIAEKTADFDTFEVELFGQTVAVPIEVNSLEALLQYADHLPELGGDFANLTNGLDAFKALKRENGNLNFIFGFVEFMAANADVLGKVFRWDDQVFDYGKVGEFITTELAGTEIETFYNDYLVGGDIQKAFTEEIAREMGYTIPEGETFDDTLNKGIKAKFLEIFGDLLSDSSKAAINDNAQFDLRTMDIYSMVKKLVGLLQNDYKDQLDDVLEGFLKALQGMIQVVAAGVNVEPPTVTIGDANTVVGTYHPGETDFAAYMPKIYSPYKEQLQGTDFYDMIEGEALPEDLAALISGTGIDMAEKFVMNVAPVPAQLTEAGFTFPIEISFADIEAYANAAIADVLAADEDGNGVGDVQDTVNAAVDAALAAGNQVAGMLGITLTGSATINSASVALSYKGYATDDTFVVEVTAIPTVDVSFDGNVWNYAQYVGITKDSIKADYIEPAIDEFVQNPAATVVVTNLSGTIEELAQLKDLIGYIDTDAAYDETLLDVSADYDAYKGVVGQANHILYKTVDMIASDAGMEYLGLVDGKNEHLTDNLQKICDKVSGLLDTMKKYIDRDTFVALAGGAGISDVFASAHGFNAGMIYDMDFSSIENALDCGIRVACDLLAEDDPDSIFYDFHMRVEDLDTLDAIAAAAVDMILGKVMKAVDLEGWTYTYTPIDYANVAEDGAEDAIMDKVVDILYAAAEFAVSKGNSAVNTLIGNVNDTFGLNIGSVDFQLGVQKNSNWNTTLSGLVDRFLQVSDGALIAASDLIGMKDVWGRLNGIVNAVLPMKTMFSNYTSLTALRGDFYDDALDGDLEGLLSHFEVKEDAIAGNVPVTFALINASDYIVDAFFPDTVQAELYTASATVQQEFTGNESDQGIAARNMVSINNRKAYFIPCLLELVVESGLLPSFACDHTNVTEVAAVAATCVAAGHSAYTVCSDCGTKFGYEEYAIDKANHAGPIETLAAVAATCTAEGKTEGKKCAACGTVTAAQQTLPKLQHTDADGDGKCDTCNTDLGGGDSGEQKTGFAAFWQRIVDFFNRIRNFFRNLFNR